MENQTLDIRPFTERKTYARKATGIIQYNPATGWIAYRVGSKNGWYVFNRITKSGKLAGKWHVGYSMTFDRAISWARQHSGCKIPTNNTSKWYRIGIIHYNFTNICEAPILNLIIKQTKN